MVPKVIRLFDLIFSVIMLLFIFPIILLILFIDFFKTTSLLYKQERLGYKKNTFIIIKLRTMSPNTPSVGTHLTNPDSITFYGKFLRRSKLDELPQLWNVIKGEMSLVGPRPGLPNQLRLTNAREKLGVFNVKPGITGLSQISGVDMSTPKLIAEIVAKMIKTMSVRNYFRYIFLTLYGIGKRDRIKKNLIYK